MVIGITPRSVTRRRLFKHPLTTEHYDANGRRTSAQTVRAIARAKANPQYTADLTPGESEATKNHDEASLGVKDNQSLRARLDLGALAPRFVYSIRGATEVEGRNCWVVEYQPKAGTSASSREDKVINALRGQLWVDKQTFAILRCDAKIDEPIRSGPHRNCGFVRIQLPKPKAIKWRGRPAIFRHRHDAESSVFLRTSAPSLYAEQLSPAGRQVNEIEWPALAHCYDALGLNMSIKSAGRLNRDGVTEAFGPSQVSPAKNDKIPASQPSRLLSSARPHRKFRPRIWPFAMVSPT